MKTRTEPAPAGVPRVYTEWLAAFEALLASPADSARLRALREGTLDGDARMTEYFLRQLDETLRKAFTDRITVFVRRTERLFEDGDLEGVEIEAGRFWALLNDWFFFEELVFIPLPKRQQISRDYARQLCAFWDRLVTRLRDEAEDARSEELSELTIRLGRTAAQWQKRRTAHEQLSADQG